MPDETTIPIEIDITAKGDAAADKLRETATGLNALDSGQRKVATSAAPATAAAKKQTDVISKMGRQLFSANTALRTFMKLTVGFYAARQFIGKIYKMKQAVEEFINKGLEKAIKAHKEYDYVINKQIEHTMDLYARAIGEKILPGLAKWKQAQFDILQMFTSTGQFEIWGDAISSALERIANMARGTAMGIAAINEATGFGARGGALGLLGKGEKKFYGGIEWMGKQTRRLLGEDVSKGFGGVMGIVGITNPFVGAFNKGIFGDIQPDLRKPGGSYSEEQLITGLMANYGLTRDQAREWAIANGYIKGRGLIYKTGGKGGAGGAGGGRVMPYRGVVNLGRTQEPSAFMREIPTIGQVMGEATQKETKALRVEAAVETGKIIGDQLISAARSGDFKAAMADALTEGAAKAAVGGIGQMFGAIAGGRFDWKKLIPAFAEGGYVDRPTLAVVGDAPGGEYIMNQAQLNALGAGIATHGFGEGGIDFGKIKPPQVNLEVRVDPTVDADIKTYRRYIRGAAKASQLEA